LIRKSEYLKKLSLKANRTDDETQELLSQENAKFLPD
jgi:hypothetical protein